MLSKGKLPMVPTFVVLSCGYLLASRKEVDSVELPYLNRARLAYTATKFLGSGGWQCCSPASRLSGRTRVLRLSFLLCTSTVRVALLRA
jgi:hypothetical protein